MPVAQVQQHQPLVNFEDLLKGIDGLQIQENGDAQSLLKFIYQS